MQYGGSLDKQYEYAEVDGGYWVVSSGEVGTSILCTTEKQAALVARLLNEHSAHELWLVSLQKAVDLWQEE
jgi:hypothetical protein